MKKTSRILAPTLALGMVFGAGSASAEEDTFKIKPGDTLKDISEKYDVSLSELKDLNPNVNPRNLNIGSEIRVKAQSDNGSNGNGNNGNENQNDNGNSTDNEIFHRVEASETLQSIADLYEDVTVEDINALNPDLDAEDLEVGSKVRVQVNNGNGPPTDKEIFHTVEPGETLESIANLHEGVTVEDINALNPDLDAEDLEVGSKVRVQANNGVDENQAEVYYTIKDGDTLAEIADLYEDVTLDDLYALNPGLDADNLEVGATIQVRGTVDGEEQNEGNETRAEVDYTIKDGDTLAEIADLYEDVTLDDLYALNPGLDADNLEVGATIQLRGTIDGEEQNEDNESQAEVYYTIEEGDTLAEIANLYEGVSLQDLYEKNPDIDPLDLTVGTQVQVR